MVLTVKQVLKCFAGWWLGHGGSWWTQPSTSLGQLSHFCYVLL